VKCDFDELITVVK